MASPRLAQGRALGAAGVAHPPHRQEHHPQTRAIQPIRAAIALGQKAKLRFFFLSNQTAFIKQKTLESLPHLN
jgi:hypothetical protein